MINETNGKLDGIVKHSLSNYEAPYDPADWATMEGMLEASPKVSTFKWSYALAFIFAVVVLAGGFFIFTKINSSKTTINSPVIPEQQQIETPAEKKPVISPNQTSPAVSTPAVTPPITEPIIETPTVIPPKTTEAEIAKKENTLKKEKESKEKIKNKKAEKVSSKIEKENAINKHQDVLIISNEPAFGDLLDSTKGTFGETKEKEESKKAKKQTEYPVGWNNFMLSNVNPDSLKHYRERMKKDSIK